MIYNLLRSTFLRGKTLMKPKKRIIALNIGLVALMIFSSVYLWIVGGRYTLHTRTFLGTDLLSESHVKISDESVLKFDRLYFDDEELVADFTAVGKGDATVNISYKIDDDEFHITERKLSVNIFGTIIDHTEGNISFNGYEVVIYAIIALLAIMEIIMLWMFIDYWRKGDFSYPMVACGGLSIYFFILLAYIVYYIINNYMLSFSFFISLVTNAGIIMLMLLTPIMLLLSVLLAVSNVWLIRHEGFRPVNALGIVFAVLWAIGTVLTVGTNVLPIEWNISLYNKIILPLIYIIGYVECLFISTVVCSSLSVRYKPPYDRDYIIILGCSIRSDGSPTPLLKGRIDSAVEFEKKQYDKTGKHAIFVPSGGQGSDEVLSEGEAMEKYLLSVGIPANQIAREDKSLNTYQNMKLSKKVIDTHSGESDSKIAFATTNYHVFRGYILAKKLGFKAKGIAAKTKLYFFPNAFLREFIGLIVDQKLKHLIFILLTALFFVFLNTI